MTDFNIQLQMELALRMVFALIIGALIGAERHMHNKPAGARTHSLVCLASTLFMIISVYGFSGFANRDPARLAAQVISGMGFIGAGVIWKEGFNIRGLTTATTLWLVSGLGLASGAGMYIPVVVSTILAYFALHFFNVWENALDKKLEARNIKPHLEEFNLQDLKSKLEKIVQEPIQYEITGQPESIVVNFQFFKNMNDPFYLTIGLKEDMLQIIILRLPSNLRGQGLGCAVCHELIQWSCFNDIKKISVTSRSDAVNFWRKNGFVQVDTKTFVINIKQTNE